MMQTGMTKERLKYLLNRYLENQATEEELKEYTDWYQKTGAEGMNMVEGGDINTTKEYTADLCSRIINAIHKNENQEKRERRIIYIRWVAAASVILIAGVFFLYHNRQISEPASIAETKTIRPDSLKDDRTVIENHDNKKKKISLNDSSVVELFPGSKLVCEFSNERRELHLTGKGFFDVAKDSSRPFTVYSNNISTTALGTSFTISAYPENKDIKVSLFTGKVVVKHIQQNKQNNMKDVYLLPGQSLSFNVSTGVATLNPLKVPAVNGSNKNSLYGGKTDYEAAFDQAPLTDVLDAIEKGYAVDIRYNKEELSDMYFSGNILKTDSLTRVLKRIAALHSLRINTNAKGYTIRKDH